MSSWNFADAWEVIARELPDRDAVLHGERRVSWAEFDRRADGVASCLIELGLRRQSSVAQYLYNGPEYLESVYAAFKAGLMPVNTNYRYADDELVYLWDNADVAAVVLDAEFVERVERIRGRLPGVRAWLVTGPGEVPDWAIPYERAAAADPRRTTGRRSPDDLYLLYTGGTTGLPKGVMWRQDDLFAQLTRSSALRYPEHGDLDDIRAALRRPADPKRPVPRNLGGPPLMHGTASFHAFSALSSGGAAVLLTRRPFDPAELLDVVQRDRVTEVSIVGDAFAKSILAELDAHPGRWDLSSMWLLVSSGVMFSHETKRGLLKHHPGLQILDALGSSEAMGVANSRSSSRNTEGTARFMLGPKARVIDEHGRDVRPGSGVAGLLAVGGRLPIGYYKDPAKSDATFRVIDGTRWSVPGDWAEVESDGAIRLLGRGSACINSGGEKVYPEEVEVVLKSHASVLDAVVVGVPHDRFGEAVVALVQTRNGSPADETELIAHVKDRLAAYKAPKRVVTVASVGRENNGKLDHRRLRERAAAEVDFAVSPAG